MGGVAGPSQEEAKRAFRKIAISVIGEQNLGTIEGKDTLERLARRALKKDDGKAFDALKGVVEADIKSAYLVIAELPDWVGGLVRDRYDTTPLQYVAKRTIMDEYHKRPHDGARAVRKARR